MRMKDAEPLETRNLAAAYGNLASHEALLSGRAKPGRAAKPPNLASLPAIELANLPDPVNGHTLAINPSDTPKPE